MLDVTFFAQRSKDHTGVVLTASKPTADFSRGGKAVLLVMEILQELEYCLLAWR
jgi:hypothetical protein